MKYIYIMIYYGVYIYIYISQFFYIFIVTLWVTKPGSNDRRPSDELRVDTMLIYLQWARATQVDLPDATWMCIV